MLTHNIKNIVDIILANLLRFHLFAYTLGESKVYLACAHHRESQKRIDNSFQIAHRSIGMQSNILNDIRRNHQSVATDFRIQDINAELMIRFLKFGNNTTGKATYHALVHILQICRCTVGGKNDATAVQKQMIEYMEERVRRLRTDLRLLHIVDNKHIKLLIESDEIWCIVLYRRLYILTLELTGTDV